MNIDFSFVSKWRGISKIFLARFTAHLPRWSFPIVPIIEPANSGDSFLGEVGEPIAVFIEWLALGKFEEEPMDSPFPAMLVLEFIQVPPLPFFFLVHFYQYRPCSWFQGGTSRTSEHPI